MVKTIENQGHIAQNTDLTELNHQFDWNLERITADTIEKRVMQKNNKIFTRTYHTYTSLEC